MKQKIGVALFLAIILGGIMSQVPSEPLTVWQTPTIVFNSPPLVKHPRETRFEPLKLKAEVRVFLKQKGSPLASHTDLLLEQEHWKLIIAISAIESTYCKHQRGNNCWGITDSNGEYKSYASLDDAIIDVNDLITRWQAKGKWLTVESMNCSYVVPCNPNWVTVVNSVVKKLELYEQRAGQISTS